MQTAYMVLVKVYYNLLIPKENLRIKIIYNFLIILSIIFRPVFLLLIVLTYVLQSIEYIYIRPYTLPFLRYVYTEVVNTPHLNSLSSIFKYNFALILFIWYQRCPVKCKIIVMHCTFREYKYEVMVGSPIHNSDMDDQDIIPLLQGVNNVERDMRGLIEGLDSFSLKKAISNQKLEKVTEAPEEKAARDELEKSWLMSHFICFAWYWCYL